MARVGNVPHRLVGLNIGSLVAWSWSCIVFRRQSGAADVVWETLELLAPAFCFLVLGDGSKCPHTPATVASSCSSCHTFPSMRDCSLKS